MARPTRFVVHLDGTDPEYAVGVHALDDGACAVEIDGETLTVYPGPNGRFLVRAEDGAQRVVTLDASSGAPAEGAVAGVRHRLRVQTPQEQALEAAIGTGAGGASSGLIKAPMPGRVVKVLVGPGDTVTAGTPVVIVEAMKMENELGAPFDGEVVSVSVSDGDAVDTGATLVSLQPHE